MMDAALFTTIFGIIAPVLIVSLIGFAWGKAEMPFDTTTITYASTHIGTPALILGVFMNLEITVDALSEIALASVLSIAAFAVIGIVVLKALGQSLSAYLPSIMLPNIGNMGLPLCLFAFGQEGLGLAIAYFAVGAVMQFTVGMSVASGGAMNLAGLFKTPVLYAVALGVAFPVMDLKAPEWFDNTVNLLGGMTIPLMLTALGVSLSRLQFSSVRRGAMVAILRMVIGVGVGFGLAELMGLTGALRGVLIIQCSMPIAVYNYLFAELYENEPEAVAGGVLLSTVISFLTLPLLLLLVL